MLTPLSTRAFSPPSSAETLTPALCASRSHTAASSPALAMLCPRARRNTRGRSLAWSNSAASSIGISMSRWACQQVATVSYEYSGSGSTGDSP